MLRAAVAIAILAACVAVGFHLTSRLSERVRIISGFLTLLDTAASRMQYTCDDLCTVFSDSFTGYVFDRDRPFSAQWLEMIAAYRGVLNRNDIQVLSEFSDELGAGDLDAQLNHLSLYKTLLSERLSDARKEQENKAKLYRVLPFSVGLTFAILLL